MSRTISERVIAPVAIGAIALATVLAAIGTWAGPDEQGSKEFLVICAVIAVAAAVVFGWVVPRGLQREAAGATALTLSILGLVAVLAFWSGLTPILAGGKYGRYDGVSDEQLLKFWEAFRPMAPEKFAERALRAVLRGDAIIVVPAWWKAWWYLERLSPALSMRAARLALKRVRGMESTTS